MQSPLTARRAGKRAAVDVLINRPPLVGRLLSSPSSGMSAVDCFTMTATGYDGETVILLAASPALPH